VTPGTFAILNPPCPRGGPFWQLLFNPDGTLEGHIYFHLGDDSAFRAERFNRVIR